jgi:hypothetical protein
MLAASMLPGRALSHLLVLGGGGTLCRLPSGGNQFRLHSEAEVFDFLPHEVFWVSSALFALKHL